MSDKRKSRSAAKPSQHAKVTPATQSGGSAAYPSNAWVLGVVAAIAIAMFWAFWPSFVAMSQRWTNDPQYSHAYFVPLFSLYLLWSRRGTIDWTDARSSWWGLPILIVGIAMKLSGAYISFDWLEAISLLPVLLGTAILLMGTPAIRFAGLAIAFLAFMIPLPHRIETGLSQPLQRIATTASTYFLQTIGQPAVSEGNVIIINSARIGVVEACNGLGMLILFFAMAAGVALVIQRSLWEKLILIASAVPIAVIVNVIRITATGLLHETIGGEWADRFFHDFAGWLMMPMALLLLWLELWVLSKAVIEVDVRARPIRIEPVASRTTKTSRKELNGAAAK